MNGPLLGLIAATGTKSIPDLVTFALSAAVIIVGALGVVLSRNPVHAALSLVMTLFGVAVLFVAQNAQFLAAVQVIVYAGAIVVLFLFVIMFLGVDRQENIEAEPLRGQRPLAIVLIVIAMGGILALAATSQWVTGAYSVAGRSTGGHRNVYELGKSVFTTYLFAFEATAALLVVAVVGAVVLARRPSDAQGDEPDELEVFDDVPDWQDDPGAEGIHAGQEATGADATPAAGATPAAVGTGRRGTEVDDAAGRGEAGQ